MVGEEVVEKAVRTFEDNLSCEACVDHLMQDQVRQVSVAYFSNNSNNYNNNSNCNINFVTVLSLGAS